MLLEETAGGSYCTGCRRPVVYHTSVHATKEDEVRLYRILDISLKRTLIQKIFGLGTIQCHSSDKTMGHFDIINVRHSYDVKNLLSDLIEKERMEKRVSNREFISDIDCDFDDDTEN